jgi:hypothetical protein
MVQVHHDEGVANRIDPESCANTREGIGEALTGERIGQPLSRESTLILGADVVPVTEGNTDGRDNASAQTARRGLRHWHVRTLFAREPGDLMVGQRQHACCTGPRREAVARTIQRVTMDGFKKCTGRPAPSACRFLQQNRRKADAHQT